MDLSTSKLSNFNKLWKIYSKQILNLKKRYFEGNSEFRVIVFWPIPKNDKSEFFETRRWSTSENHLTSDQERDNSWVFKFEKNHTLEKNSEFRVRKVHLLIELLISLLILWVLEETRQTLFELKALVDSEKFRVIFFQYRAKNDNSKLWIFT